MISPEQAIRDYIAQNIIFSAQGFPYSDDTSFLNEGIIDSMNVLELVMFVEEQFGFPVQDQDLTPDNFDSVERLAAYVRLRGGPSMVSSTVPGTAAARAA